MLDRDKTKHAEARQCEGIVWENVGEARHNMNGATGLRINRNQPSDHSWGRDGKMTMSRVRIHGHIVRYSTDARPFVPINGIIAEMKWGDSMVANPEDRAGTDKRRGSKHERPDAATVQKQWDIGPREATRECTRDSGVGRMDAGASCLLCYGIRQQPTIACRR